MRQTQIFSGSSHPGLVDAICERLGQSPAKAELGKFSNGETKVQLRNCYPEEISVPKLMHDQIPRSASRMCLSSRAVAISTTNSTYLSLSS